MYEGSTPETVTSRRCIRYRKSTWHVHQFEVWSEVLVCRVAAVKMEGSLLLWIGGSNQPQLAEIAVGFPEVLKSRNGALGTTLTGVDGWAVSLARRLSALLARPVFVCCGEAFDRFTRQLVERGLITEIKSKPDCF